MRTIFCRGCGVQIHEDAQACPHCGAPQARVAAHSEADARSPWIAWTALLLSLLVVISLFADGAWSRDEVGGVCLVGAIAIALAGVSLAQGRPGKAVAIVALVAGLIGFLGAAGHLN